MLQQPFTGLLLLSALQLCSSFHCGTSILERSTKINHNNVYPSTRRMASQLNVLKDDVTVLEEENIVSPGSGRETSRETRKRYEHEKEVNGGGDGDGELMGNNNNNNINRNGDEYMELVDEMAESLDISRETTRLDSLGSYTLVSCLTATTSFSTVKGLTLDDSSLFMIFLHYAATLVSSLSAISGIYATVVFSLVSAYGRTCIGMGKDDAYDVFMDDTKEIRAKSFDAFVLSLALFMVEMTLVTTEFMDAPIRIPFMVAFSAFSVYIYSDWKNIMGAAGKIFS